MPGWGHLVIENLGFPGNLSSAGIEGKGEVVVTCVDDETTIDGDVAIVACIAAHVVVDVLRQISTIFPLKVTRYSFNCLNDVARIWHIQDPFVG